MNANRVAGWLRDAPRLASLLLFEILGFFWCVKLGYCLYSYFTKGPAGVREAILRHTINPYGPHEWGPPGNPRWDIVVMRYALIALLTVVLGLINRRTLRKFWAELWQRPHPRPDS